MKTWTPILILHTLQTLIFVEWPSHQGCILETSQRLDERTTKILEVCERLEAKWSTKPSSFFGRIASAFWWEKTEKGKEGKASRVENLWSLSFCLVGSKKIWWKCKKMVNNYFNLKLFCFIFPPILSERQKGCFWTIFGKIFILENLKYILCFGFFYLLIHL